MIRRILAISVLLAPIGFYGGCGGSDCLSVCEEAQDGGCTWVDQPCDDVCAAVEKIDPCVEDLDAYVDCLNGYSDVCESECGSKEINLTACVTDYCTHNPQSSSCQELAGLQ